MQVSHLDPCSLVKHVSKVLCWWFFFAVTIAKLAIDDFWDFSSDAVCFRRFPSIKSWRHHRPSFNQFPHCLFGNCVAFSLYCCPKQGWSQTGGSRISSGSISSAGIWITNTSGWENKALGLPRQGVVYQLLGNLVRHLQSGDAVYGKTVPAVSRIWLWDADDQCR